MTGTALLQILLPRGNVRKMHIGYHIKDSKISKKFAALDEILRRQIGVNRCAKKTIARAIV